MIIDSQLVFLDGEDISAAATGNAVALTSFLKPGREEPIPICIRMVEAAAGGTSIALTLQECDSEKGTFADVPGASLTVALADLGAGARLGWRWLPPAVEKPWVRLSITPTGTFTAGKIFAALAREDDLPYAAGMHIAGGVAAG